MHQRQLEQLLEQQRGLGRDAVGEAGAEAERVAGDLFGRVAAKRQEFVQEVLALRAAVAEAQGQHQALADDAEVKDALAELNTSLSARQKLKIGSTADYPRSLRDLAEFEKVIQLERIPLEPDKLVHWVEVTLDGGSKAPMVLAPDVEAVPLSTRFAAEVGVQPAASGPARSLTLDDGRTFQARRATLRSVQVGPWTVEGVECLIMPEDYGDPPPLLGASFLDHFAHLVDPETDTLTPARVIPRAAQD